MRELSSTVRVKLFGKSYLPSTTDIVLTIGKESFDKDRLVNDVESAAFKAAHTLTDHCKALRITTVAQIAAKGAAFWIDRKGIGAEALWIIMNLLHREGINPGVWVGEDYEKVATIATLKNRKRLGQLSVNKPSKKAS